MMKSVKWIKAILVLLLILVTVLAGWILVTVGSEA
jgi:hypothetical protein